MKTTTQNKMQTSKATLVVLFVLLLSSVGMSGQNVAQAQESVNVEVSVSSDDNIVATTTDAANSTMNIVSWFMGSKQTPKATISNEGPVSAKKQMINAGIAPNRLLIKAFGKKAANYQSTIA